MALRPDELRRIAEGLGREPTTVELYAFDAQWSEHCSYKSSRHLLKKLPTTGPNVVVGPGEDAGVVYLGEHEGERYCVVVAHESHNHPSQVVPFEGAATGVGGIVRDVLCMGAEVIALADCLRFGNVEDPNSHQRYVAQQVVDGIAAYGNAIGVPNIAGDVYFDEGFNDNCLVNVIALGLVKESEIIHSRAPEGSAGWDIVLVGKATDASGFGGASFSSLTLEEGNQEANKSAVQVPDPFLKNVIMRATYRVFEYLREKKITAGFKDLGAGGIMGCTAELCAAGGFGAIIDLDDVNVAVENLPPEVIAVGETQERLCWVLPGDVTLDVLRIYNEEFSLPEIARGARATVIGAVQTEKHYVMRHGGDIVMDVPIDFLTGAISDEAALNGEEPPRADEPVAQHLIDETPRFIEDYDLKSLLPQVLRDYDVCSREPLYKHYDAVVRGRTVIARGKADAGVVAPIHGSRLGVALSVAGNPRQGTLDPYLAAQHAVLSAVYKIYAVGARPLGLTDCLNFGNPRNADQYAKLAQAAKGLAHAGERLRLPFVSGNVSLYNETGSGASVPASPIVACVGALDDIGEVVTRNVRLSDSMAFFVGRATGSIAGSAVSRFVDGPKSALPPIDFDAELRRFAFLSEIVRARLVLSATAITAGGILPALAIAGFGAPISRASICFGRIDFFTPPMGDVEVWFGQSDGVLVQISRSDVGRFWEFCKAHRLEPMADYFECGDIPGGWDAPSGFHCMECPEGKVEWTYDELRDSWSKTLGYIFA